MAWRQAGNGGGEAVAAAWRQNVGGKDDEAGMLTRPPLTPQAWQCSSQAQERTAGV